MQSMYGFQPIAKYALKNKYKFWVSKNAENIIFRQGQRYKEKKWEDKKRQAKWVKKKDK